MSKKLITQCPECQTRFDISREQLQAANGRVRCGHCQQVFDAIQHIESSSKISPAIANDGIAREPLRLHYQRPGSTWAKLFGWLLALSASLTLIGQTLWFERDQLSLHPELQPLYQQLCQRVDCRLAPRQDLPSIQSQRLLVRQHPEYANALTLDLTLINQAPFDQPFPGLKLNFSGLDNSLRASRTFQPREYLAGDLQPGDLMPSRSPVQVHLELLDPGTLAPSYQLQFVPAKP
jgi:predicted Zn finger-like uncharacterized protein